MTENGTSFQEEDVLDMLAQCEADEKDGKLTTNNRSIRVPKVSHNAPSAVMT